MDLQEVSRAVDKRPCLVLLPLESREQERDEKIETKIDHPCLQGKDTQFNLKIYVGLSSQSPGRAFLALSFVVGVAASWNRADLGSPSRAQLCVAATVKRR